MSVFQRTACEGKVAFATWTLASKAAARRKGRMAYRCQFCGMFHVGNRAKK